MKGETDMSLERSGSAVHVLDPLLRPQSLAVLGASAQRVAGGNRAIRNLLQHGFAEDMIRVVHPRGEEIEGLLSVTKVQDLPEHLDTALVSLPAPQLAETAHALVNQGCKSLIVASAGLDVRTTAALRDLSSQSGVPIHGPNCMGVINLTDDIPLWFYGSFVDSEPGDTALITQSGSASFIVRAAERARFSKIISSGNELTVTTADYLSWLAEDDATATVGVVIESIPDISAFTRSVAKLREAGKDLVVLKVGRTALGQLATTAHTSALIGPDEAYQALFDRLDVPVVHDYDEMAVTLDALSGPFRKPAGARVAVITDSGGQAALAADIAARNGIQIPEFSAETSERLRSILNVAEVNNPLDAGSTGGGVEKYVAAFRAVVAAPEIDSIMVITEGHISLNEAEVRDKEKYYDPAVRAAADAADGSKPLVVVTSSSVSTHPLLSELMGANVPILRGIPNGLRALTGAAKNRRPVQTEHTRPQFVPPHHKVEELRARFAQQRREGDRNAVPSLLRSYGLEYVDSLSGTDVEAALSWASSRYPIVAKVDSAAVAHRSDIGGVVVGISSDEELRAGLKQIRQRVAAAIGEDQECAFELQETASGVEAILGFLADPVFGAVLTVGSGGTTVELQKDVATALAPLSIREAVEAIERTRLGSVLAGYRNLVPVTDVNGLAEAMCKLSWLAADMSGLIAEADLNPVFIQPGSGTVRLVDALFVPEPDSVGREP